MVKNPPTSGSEHIFTTRKWGGPVGKNNNNCSRMQFTIFKNTEIGKVSLVNARV